MDMKFNLIFHQEAEKEYLNAVKWYEEISKGLGFELVLEVEKILDLI